MIDDRLSHFIYILTTICNHLQLYKYLKSSCYNIYIERLHDKIHSHLKALTVRATVKEYHLEIYISITLTLKISLFTRRE